MDVWTTRATMVIFLSLLISLGVIEISCLKNMDSTHFHTELIFNNI